MTQTYPFEKATPQHRLGGIALDSVFCFMTLYIGFIVWSLIIWGQGQTPGKQILRMRVYSNRTGKPANWPHMALRQFVIPVFFASIYWILIIAGATGSSISRHLFASGISESAATVLVGLAGLTSVVIWLTDAFWILKKEDRRRLTDIWVKTDVLNECAPSTQDGSI